MKFGALLGTVIVWLGCASLTPAPDAEQDRPRPIYLIDRWGERFDITHAVAQYGMVQDGFGFGIGRNAIPPLNHPEMVAPEEDGYPAPWSGQEVIGLQVGGESRSYPIAPLAAHEIVEETIAGAPAAVAY